MNQVILMCKLAFSSKKVCSALLIMIGTFSALFVISLFIVSILPNEIRLFEGLGSDFLKLFVIVFSLTVLSVCFLVRDYFADVSNKPFSDVESKTFDDYLMARSASQRGSALKFVLLPLNKSQSIIVVVYLLVAFFVLFGF